MILSTCFNAEKLYKKPPKRLLEKLAAALDSLTGANIGEGIFELTFASSEMMTEINGDFLGHSGDTDVICFDYRNDEDATLENETMPSVDIIVCPAVAEREAAKRNLKYSREITLYIAHGLLHAAGYDDLAPIKKRRMRRAEKRVMDEIEKQFDLDKIFRFAESKNTTETV